MLSPFISCRDLRRRLSFNRNERTLTFTVTQPPKILEPFTGNCAGCSLSGADWDLGGPMYQLAGDPTAPYRLGMKLPSFCPLCAPDEWLEDRDYGWALREQEPQIGSRMAGVDGSLGRCFTYRLKLHPYAVKGDHSCVGILCWTLRSGVIEDAKKAMACNDKMLHVKCPCQQLLLACFVSACVDSTSLLVPASSKLLVCLTELDANPKHLRRLSSFRLISKGDYHRWQRSQREAPQNTSRIAALQADADNQDSSADERVVSRSQWEAQQGVCKLNEMLEGLDYMVAYNVSAGSVPMQGSEYSSSMTIGG